MCGSCSIENSFKLCYYKFMDKERGGKDFTEEDMQSAMVSKAPGMHRKCSTLYSSCNDLSVYT